jgi:sterol 24-C-methyltransferase
MTNSQLARHEHYLAHMLNLQPGMKVLDVGCGVGGPAREIARFSDANITGVNNNDFQIQRATAKTRKQGLSAKVNFRKGDFMKLSEEFGENSFDASEYGGCVADPSLRHRGHMPRSQL